MKINFNNAKKGCPISEVHCGDTFLAERSKDRKEVGLYLKIDQHNGVIPAHHSMNYAVNLATGQIRIFPETTIVERIMAEVNFSK